MTMPALPKAVVAGSPYRLVVRRWIVPWLLDVACPTGSGLEVGAGSGVVSACVMARCPDLQMTVTDADPDMVARGHKLLAPFGDRATAQTADAVRLPYDDAAFDLVICAAMLHHVKEWRTAVEESVRVLRPGGRLLGYDLLDTRLSRLIHGFERHSTRMLRRGEVEPLLAALPPGGVGVRSAGRGQVVRFQATKTA